MRSVLHSDLCAVARVLLLVPQADRPEVCKGICREADWADRYVRRVGRRHLKWGNGTLLAAARARRLAPEPTLDDRDYCSCLEMVLHHLAEMRALSHRRSQVDPLR